MLKKVIDKINSILILRFRFDLPKKNKILLYDEVHFKVLKEIIKRDFNILELRNKKIYFWIYLKQIIFFDFSFKTYSKNYIKFTSPKVIITFNDARFQMYELKKDFEDISFVSVMNGLRFSYWFKNNKIGWFDNSNKTRWPKNLRSDYFFALS